MPLFVIAEMFAQNDTDLDFSQAIDWVGVPELWLHFPLNMDRLDKARMKPLLSLNIYGDGLGTIPHFTRSEILKIKSCCEYMHSLDITPIHIKKEKLPDYYIEEFTEYLVALEKLIVLCDRAISEGLIMAFLPE